jgi:hypothetical protein
MGGVRFETETSVDGQHVFPGVAVLRALATPERRNAGKMFVKSLGFFAHNNGNREPLFVPGGSAMWILIPWKPVVLVWGLLSGMIFFGFVASSVLRGKDPLRARCDDHSAASLKNGRCTSGATEALPQNGSNSKSVRPQRFLRADFFA